MKPPKLLTAIEHETLIFYENVTKTMHSAKILMQHDPAKFVDMTNYIIALHADVKAHVENTGLIPKENDNVN